MINLQMYAPQPEHSWAHLPYQISDRGDTRNLVDDRLWFVPRCTSSEKGDGCEGRAGDGGTGELDRSLEYFNSDS